MTIPARRWLASNYTWSAVGLLTLAGLIVGCSGSSSEVGQGSAAPAVDPAAPPPSRASQPAGRTTSDTPSPGGATAVIPTAKTPPAGQPSPAIAGSSAPAVVNATAEEGATPLGLPTSVVVQEGVLAWTEPASGSRTYPIHLTLDGDVAMVHTFDGANPVIPVGNKAPLPLAATITWKDYRDGKETVKRAVIESPTLVRITAAPPPAPVAALPSAGATPPMGFPPAGTPPVAPVPSATPSSTAERIAFMKKGKPSSPADADLTMPGEVADIAAGGGDRFLLLSVPSQKQVVVVDLRECKIRRTIDAGSDDFLIAAGATRFVILGCKTRALVRYNFATLEVEQRTTIPATPGPPVCMAMSEFGEGPLWIIDDPKAAAPPRNARTNNRPKTAPRVPVRLFDLTRLAPLPTNFQEPEDMLTPLGNPWSRLGVSVSASGERFCAASSSSPLLLRYTVGSVSLEKSSGVAGDDARILPQGRLLLDDNEVSDGEYQQGKSRFYFAEKAALSVPYSSSNSCFTVQWDQLKSENGVVQPCALNLSFHPRLQRKACAVLRLADVGRDAYEERKSSDSYKRTLSRRLHFSAAEKVFSYAVGKDRLLLKRFDPDAPENLIPGSDSDEVPVVRPLADGGAVPTAATAHAIPFTRGKPFEQALTAAPTPGDISYSLVAGPPGMKVSAEGKIQWTPTARSEDRYTAIIAVDKKAEDRRYEVLRLESDAAPERKSYRIERPNYPPGRAPTPTPDAFAGDLKFQPVAYRVRTFDGDGRRLLKAREVTGNGRGFVLPGAVQVAELEGATDGSLVFTMSDGTRRQARPIYASFAVVKSQASPVDAPQPPKMVGAETGDAPDAVVPLPGPVSDMVAAGDGRYVLVALKSLRSVAVFDVRKAKITACAAVDSDDFEVAGGLTRFVTYDRTTRIFSRRKLADGSLEKEAELDEDFDYLQTMAMGMRTEGPILIKWDEVRSDADNLESIDLETLAPTKLEVYDGLRKGAERNQLTISADGRRATLGQTRSYHEDRGPQLLELADNVARVVETLASNDAILKVAHDGESYYQGGERKYLAHSRATSGRGDTMVSGDGGAGPFWYSAGFGLADAQGALPIRFFAGADERPIAKLKLAGYGAAKDSPLSVARRIHYTTPEKTLAVVADGPSRILVKRFDADAAMRAVDFDLLAVTTSAPAAFARQPTLSLKIDAFSRRGGVKYRLFSGPADMTVSPEGLVTWRNAAGPERQTLRSVVAVSDASGKEFHFGFDVPSSAEATAGGGISGTDRTIDLPAAPTQVVGGGDGKYLLMTFPAQRKLALFDVGSTAAPRYLDVGTSEFLVAAGQTRFVVVDPKQRKISRYRLETGELEKSATLESSANGIGAAAMGVASEGPVFLWDRDFLKGHDTPLRFVDLETFEFRKIEIDDWNTLWTFGDARIAGVSASGDGKSFCIVKTERPEDRPGSEQLFSQMFALYGNRAVCIKKKFDADPLTRINYDGASVDMSSERQYPDGESFRFRGSGGDVTPHLGGACYSDSLWFTVRPQTKQDPFEIDFHLGREDDVVVTWRNIGGFKGADYSTIGARCFYSPREKTLVAVRDKPNQLVVRSFDFDATVKQKGVNYIVFAGTPPMFYRPGEKLSYQTKVLTTGANLKFALESGPKGMTLSPTGLLEWDVPADASGTVDVDLFASVTHWSIPGSGTGRDLEFKMTAARAVSPPLVADAGPVDRDAAFVTIPLSGKIDRVALGAGGKYLLAAIGSQQSVAIVDVRERKVVKTLSMDDDRLRIAAGAAKFVVYCGRSKELHRYDFATLERDLTATLDHEPADIAAGSSSEGPIATIHLEEGMRLLSMQTLRQLAVVDNTHPRLRTIEGDHVLASGDGRRFVKWDTTTQAGTSDDVAKVLLFDGTRMRTESETKSSGTHLLSPDGLILHTSRGRYDLRGKSLWTDNSKQTQPCIPSVTGDYYVSWKPYKRPEGGYHPLELFAAGDERPLALVEGIPPPQLPQDYLRTDALRSMRFQFIPSALALVTIPLSDDRLVVHRLNFDALLKASTRDYLFAASSPPSVAVAGEPYQYQLDVKTRRGGVTFRLETKPEGMEISPTGLIRWNVPSGLDRKEPIVVRFKDASGVEAGQTFEIQTVAGAPRESRERHVVRLEGPLNRAVPGGGGRYLVLYFAPSKKIGVVDLVERKIVGYLTVEEEPRIAAGREKFVVCLPTKKQFVRYDLATCKPEQTTTFAEMGQVSVLVMGSDSAGPILLGHKRADSDGGEKFGIDFIDPATLLPLPVKLVDPEPNWPFGYPAWFASADGRLFSNAERFNLIRLQGDSAVVNRPEGFAGGGRVPDGDGEVLYGYEAPVTPDGAKLEDFARANDWERPRPYPAPRGPLVLRYENPGRNHAPADYRQPRMTVFVRDDARPQLQMIDVEGPTSEGENQGFYVGYDNAPLMRERIFFVPHLKLLAIVPDKLDQVIVHEFDFDEEVKRRTDEYLFVYAAAPAPIEAGKPWTYQLDVRSKHGGLTYRIENGPPGMTVSAGGLLSWTPPAAAAAIPPAVVVVRDSTGRELSHTVRIKTAGVALAKGAEYRTWKSIDGQFSISAVLVELRGDTAVLKAADGRVMEIPLDRLSPADQAFARAQGRKP